MLLPILKVHLIRVPDQLQIKSTSAAARLPRGIITKKTAEA
ncbi:hypothetical protein QW060_13810 [Myroides ceti]|uniref:Uncharacterized protein n=1 Tax=Paenimyroides ceti TaxID=395087 RepID=A0ABT8CUJ7_9FLAO|nr:hypothetical protein [Paenimyroides ceti]MDN3708182.1 hypothetical protein [Paenimyroides ceti]